MGGGKAEEGEEVKTEDATMEPKEEDTKDETKEDETKEEPKEEEEEEPEEPDEEEPVAELTADEQATKFAHKQMPDITQTAFNKSFARFSLPDKAEGFDGVFFEWDKAGPAMQYFNNFLV